MLKSKRLITTVIFLTISVFTLYADFFQSLKWNLLPSYYLPISKSTDLYDNGTGIKIYAELPLFTYFQLGANAGYNIMATPADNDLTMTTAGANAGFNYFVTSRLNMALIADGGYYFASYNNISEKNPYLGGNLRASYYLKPNISIIAEGGYYQFLTAADPRFEGIKFPLVQAFQEAAEMTVILMLMMLSLIRYILFFINIMMKMISANSPSRILKTAA